MKFARAFMFVAGEPLKQKSLWVFLVIIALVGPIYVVLDSQTKLDVWENRPILSEAATVEHFNTGLSATGFVGGVRDPAVQLFRTPETETPFGTYVSLVLAPGGSLFDFHRHILPILMIMIGILALPSRQHLYIQTHLLPCGRLGHFLMIACSLATFVVLLTIASGVATTIGLSVTGNLTWAIAGFIAKYSAAIVIVALAFAFLGLAIGGVMRARTMAFLIGLVSGLGVLPLASHIHLRLWIGFYQWTLTPSASAVMENPLLRLGMRLLLPPQWALEALSTQMQRFAMGVANGPVGTSAPILLALALFMVFWCFIAWAAFPHVIKETQ